MCLLFFNFSPNDNPKYEKCFLFHLKSSFRSQDIQVFVILSSPLFLLVGHCFRGWSMINLKVYDVINCLKKNLKNFRENLFQYFLKIWNLCTWFMQIYAENVTYSLRKVFSIYSTLWTFVLLSTAHLTKCLWHHRSRYLTAENCLQKMKIKSF